MNVRNGGAAAMAVAPEECACPPARRFHLLPVPVPGLSDWQLRVAAWARPTNLNSTEGLA